MKRKIFFLVSVLGLALIIFGVMRFMGNRTPKKGILRVDSQPAAAIFLNNTNIGRTPYKEEVDAGEYTIKLVPESTTTQLVSWQGKVTVGKNLLTFVNASLSDSELTTAVDIVWLEKITSKQSELSITTSPDGATVLVDDVTRGITPISLTDISAGEHSVSITSVGFLTRTLGIKTTAGYRLIADLKLALSGIASTPPASPSAGVVDATKSPTPKPSVTKAASQSGTLVPDPEKPFVIIKDTPTGFLRVRIEPSTSATEAARVNPGDKFTIQDTDNGWYKIIYEGTKTGWVSGQYVEKVE